MGGSQGGFVSALFAANHPELVEKLVLFFPALCIPDDARAGKMMLAQFDPNNIPEVLHCGPMKLGRCYPADVMNLGPYEEIAPYEGQVLIVHGTKDNIVDLEYSKRAQKAYKNARLEIIRDGAHGFSPKHDEIAIEYLCEFAALEVKNEI
jgi:pimeloyl-ACP methyl ester carboxylesterase